MGAATSKNCCTMSNRPPSLTVYDHKVNLENDATDTPVKATTVLKLDPRSPTVGIERTPIEVVAFQTPLKDKANEETSCLQLPDNSKEDEQESVAKDTSSLTHVTSLDPRSPSANINRTPMQTKETKPLHQGGFVNFSYDNQSISNNGDGNIVQTPNATKTVDPCSPSAEIKRTPIQIYGNERILSSDCTTPTRIPAMEIMDPRSPSDVFRTPILVEETKEIDSSIRRSTEPAQTPKDPRSPLNDPSRTPLTAFLAGGNLRKTVLMSNAILASPARSPHKMTKMSLDSDTSSLNESNSSTRGSCDFSTASLVVNMGSPISQFDMDEDDLQLSSGNYDVTDDSLLDDGSPGNILFEDDDEIKNTDEVAPDPVIDDIFSSLPEEDIIDDGNNKCANVEDSDDVKNEQFPKEVILQKEKGHDEGEMQEPGDKNAPLNYVEDEKCQVDKNFDNQLIEKIKSTKTSVQEKHEGDVANNTEETNNDNTKKVAKLQLHENDINIETDEINAINQSDKKITDNNNLNNNECASDKLDIKTHNMQDNTVTVTVGSTVAIDKLVVIKSKQETQLDIIQDNTVNDTIGPISMEYDSEKKQILKERKVLSLNMTENDVVMSPKKPESFKKKKQMESLKPGKPLSMSKTSNSSLIPKRSRSCSGERQSKPLSPVIITVSPQQTQQTKNDNKQKHKPRIHQDKLTKPRAWSLSDVQANSENIPNNKKEKTSTKGLSRQISGPAGRKSDFKTRATPRSPLAVLNNSDQENNRNRSRAPFRSKVPRYQGTPPFPAVKRSLSLTGNSNNQSSISYGKEN